MIDYPDYKTEMSNPDEKNLRKLGKFMSVVKGVGVKSNENSGG